MTSPAWRVIVSGYFAIRQTLAAAFFWLIGFPLKMAIKRDTSLMAVINAPGAAFADNNKYFFVYANEMLGPGERVVFLTTSRTTHGMITVAGAESVVHPSWRSLFLLLKCGTVITDFDWFKFGAYPLTHGAELIQIWHGAPLKHIELDLYRKRLAGMPTWLRPLLEVQKTIIGRYPFYDIVVATSQWFITEVFQHCFKAKNSSRQATREMIFYLGGLILAVFLTDWLGSMLIKRSFRRLGQLGPTGIRFACMYQLFERIWPDRLKKRSICHVCPHLPKITTCLLC